MFQVDLSRFSACTIRHVKLVELMHFPEFRQYVDEYYGEITDAWVLSTARRMEKDLHSTPEYAAYLIQKYGYVGYERHRQKYMKCHRLVKQIVKEMCLHE